MQVISKVRMMQVVKRKVRRMWGRNNLEQKIVNEQMMRGMTIAMRAVTQGVVIAIVNRVLKAVVMKTGLVMIRLMRYSSKDTK